MAGKTALPIRLDFHPFAVRWQGLTGGSRAVRSSVASSASLPPISPDTLLRKVQQDYRDRTYFLTGDISEECYDADCVFTGESRESGKQLGRAPHGLTAVSPVLRLRRPDHLVHGPGHVEAEPGLADAVRRGPQHHPVRGPARQVRSALPPMGRLPPRH